MQTLVFDTNVLLDALLLRAPFADAALEAVRLVDRGAIRGCITATSVAALYFFLRKRNGESSARQDLRDLADTFVISPVETGLIQSALTRAGSDFEDDLVIETAIREGASAILTRDPSGFRASPVPAVSPSEWLAGA